MLAYPHAISAQILLEAVGHEDGRRVALPGGGREGELLEHGRGRVGSTQIGGQRGEPGLLLGLRLWCGLGSAEQR